MFVELVAYVGDELSCYQDEVANEAYLGTAPERASLRGLTPLLSYRLRNGVTAGVSVQFGIVESCQAGPLAARTVVTGAMNEPIGTPPARSAPPLVSAQAADLEPLIAWGKWMLLDTSYAASPGTQTAPRLTKVRVDLIKNYPRVGPIFA